MTGRESVSSDRDALRARLEQARATIASSLEEYQESQRASATQREEAQEAQAAAARTGKLGPEWTKVQQRIDLQQTTLEDVFSGKDDSPEARALLATSRQTLTLVSEELEEQAEKDEEAGTPNPLIEIRAMNSAMEAKLERLRSLNRND